MLDSDYDAYSWLMKDSWSLQRWVGFFGTIFTMIAYWKVAHSPLFAGPQKPRALGFRNFNPFNRVFFGAIAAFVLGTGILYLYGVAVAQSINRIFMDIFF